MPLSPLRIACRHETRLALTIAVIASACGGGSTEPTDTNPTAVSSDATTPTTPMSTTTVAELEGEPDEETGTTEAPSAEGSNTGSSGCTIRVSGDVEETIEYPDSVFLSDHWSSEEELREYVEFMGEDILEGT